MWMLPLPQRAIDTIDCQNISKYKHLNILRHSMLLSLGDCALINSNNRQIMINIDKGHRNVHFTTLLWYIVCDYSVQPVICVISGGMQASWLLLDALWIYLNLLFTGVFLRSLFQWKRSSNKRSILLKDGSARFLRVYSPTPYTIPHLFSWNRRLCSAELHWH